VECMENACTVEFVTMNMKMVECMENANTVEFVIMNEVEVTKENANTVEIVIISGPNLDAPTLTPERKGKNAFFVINRKFQDVRAV